MCRTSRTAYFHTWIAASTAEEENRGVSPDIHQYRDAFEPSIEGKTSAIRAQILQSDFPT